MATSGDVWTNDVGNSRLHLYWWLDGSTINWWLKFSKDDSNYRILWNYAVYRNDTWIDGSSSQRNVYDGDTIGSGSFNISTLGSSSYLKFSIEGGIGTSSVNASGSDDWTVSAYAKITASVYARGVNFITINWSTDANVDTFQYKLGSGSWVNAQTNINTRSGRFTINGLTPNTNYLINFDAKRTDSQQWSSWGGSSYSASVSTSTKQKAIITASNFTLGDSEPITFTNPSDGSVLQASIKTNDGLTDIASYRTVTGTSYIFNFTDEEQDKIYKLYGNQNSVSLRAYIKTTVNNSSYTDYKTISCAVSGNQKTGWVKVNNTWKRTKRWIKVDGTWKRCVRWVNVNGTWKRCI